MKKKLCKGKFFLKFLFVLTCALACVGNALLGGSTASAATNCFYTVEIRAICETGASGNVNVKTGTQNANTGSTLTTNINGCTNTVATLNGSRSITTSDLPVTFYAKPGSGSIVEGWYSDANGENELVLDANTPPYITMLNDQFSINVNSVYTGAGRAVKIKHSMYYEAGVKGYDADHRSTITVYVKFAKEASGNKFKPQLTATSSNFSQGHIAISMTSTGSLSKVAQTAGPVDYTLTEESSLSQTFSVRAQPMRGYKFVNWTVAGTPRTTDKETSDLPLESFTVTLTDEMTPGANDVISNNDIVTANFAEDALKDFKIRKEANTGSVTGSYLYYYIISGGNSTTHTDPISSLALADTEKDYQLYGTDKITLTATPAEGYNFSGWYVRRESQPDELLTTEATLITYLTEDNLIFVPVFALDVSGLVISEEDNFLVGYSTCTTFEQALAAATQSQHKTILQLKDYTVPAGNYVIPAGVTLLIPYAEEQSTPATTLPRVGNENATSGNAYRTLTLASSVNLDVYGTIEVSGRQATGVSGAGGEEGIGCPTGDYGCLYMSAGSFITLNNGALLRGWGYVLGDRDGQGKYQCEIDARRGARVQEQFQIMDWKGGQYTVGMTDGINSYPGEKQVLPVNQYYIQNVEVPVKYRPGAKLQANASAFVNGTFYGMTLNNIIFNIDNVGIIGARYHNQDLEDDRAIFLMDNEDDSEDTWVRKYYDVVNDKQVYEVNNAASLGSLVLNVFGVDVSSTEYKLPITNNFQIHLLYGNMEVTQRTEILPGAEIEIDKEAALSIPQNVTLYLWDKDDWGDFVSTTRNPNSTFTFGPATTVKWRPGGRPDVRRDPNTNKVIISDARLTLHGSANVEGYLKTTTHGASVTSTIADAGTVVFSNNTPADADAGKVWQVQSLPADNSHSGGFIGINCTSAQLMNEDGTFASTASTVATEQAPISYCFIDFDGDGNGEWKSLATFDCVVKDENDVYYIKPQEYVAISQGAAPVEEADHTYRDHYAGTDRIFIPSADGNCQWWEVRVVPDHPDLFECINENNHTFYYYSEEWENWEEKKFKVSWVNWDGSPVNYTNKEQQLVNYYMVTYGTVPTWLSANPTHADDASHTYSFSGWMPTPAAVTEDVTYTAQYEERDRMYAITFNDENDELIQLLYCKLGEIPECTKYDAAANNKVWKTAGGEAIGAVAGDVTYKLFAKETKDNYTIRFVNWNGDELQSSPVAAGSMPSAPADPEKASDDLHSYTFKAWNPALVAADADATYTATYDAGPRGYTVTWKNGEATLDTDENVLYGATPEYTGATPTKAADADYSYTFKGWEPAVSAVTGNATYTATFYKNIQVTANKSIDANVTVQSIVVDNEHKLTIAGATVNTDYLILNGTASNSGQIVTTGGAMINAANAYFDLNLNVDARHWRSFGVPWVVNLDMTPLTEVESGRALVLGRDYDIIWYNGAKRATNGPGANCWEYVEHHTHILQPGQGYMIAFISHVNTVRFAKSTGTPVIFSGTMNVPANDGGEATNNGINAIANPMAYHATLGVAGVGQVHDGGEMGHDGYTTYDLSDPFVVGKAVYVQVASGQSLTPSSGISPAAAPARRAAKATDKEYLGLSDFYAVSLKNTTNGQEATVYVLPEEDKANEYVIGHDLVKMGMSDLKPQIWVNRYNAKLCLNTTAPVNETAEFPVNLYAPAAGDYTIDLDQSPITNDQSYIVYLTQNGEAIWNLSDAPYALSLPAGVNKTYGLRLSARKSPAVATGIDEAVVNAKGDIGKVLINNQVFIIRGNEVYTIDGQLVK